MGLQGIAVYTLRAAAFAAAVTLVYALILRARGRKLAAGRLVSVFYVAALIEITVLRGGVEWGSLLSAMRVSPQWMPFKTTAGAFRGGAWPFVYHVAGNLMWFVPVGVILHRRPFWAALAGGTLLSTLIEGLQWVLMTGMADVDDVMLNACGALVGWLLAWLILRRGRGNGRQS